MRPIIVLIFFLLSFTACENNLFRTKKAIRWALPASIDPITEKESIESLKLWIKFHTNIEIEFQPIIDNKLIPSLIEKNKIDLALMHYGQMWPLIKQKKIEPLLVSIKKNSATHKMQILSLKKEKINSLADLNNLDITFLNQESFTGCYWPLYVLKQNNINLNSISYSRSQVNSLYSLIFEKTHAIAVYDDARELLSNEMPQQMESLKQIYSGGLIPNTSIVASSHIQNETLEQIKISIIKFLENTENKIYFKNLFNYSDWQIPDQQIYKNPIINEDEKLQLELIENCSYNKKKLNKVQK